MSNIASFSSGFFNSDRGDRLYNAEQMSRLFDGLIHDGVYAGVGGRFLVTADSDTDNSVLIDSGRAWFDHTWCLLESQIEYSGIIPAPPVSKYRYDAIVLDINHETRDNDIMVVSGEEASTISVKGIASDSAANPATMADTTIQISPPRPTLIKTSTHSQYPICYILRKYNHPRITEADIVYMVGTSACPIVTGIITSGNIDSYVKEWAAQWAQFKKTYETDASQWFAAQQAEFTSWSTTQKNEFATWMAGEKTDFDTWFANLQYILDGDVAGHLQNEIDNLTTRAVSITLLASGWNNGVYSLESQFPSNTITIENVLPNSSTTSAMRKAWQKADCNGYEATNIIRAHGKIPTINIVLTAIVRGGI